MHSIIVFLCIISAVSCYMVTPHKDCVKEFTYHGTKFHGCSLENSIDWWCALHEDYDNHLQWKLCDQKRLVYETKKDDFYKVLERIKSLQKQLDKPATGSCKCENTVKDVRTAMDLQTRLMEEQKRSLAGFSKLKDTAKSNRIFLEQVKKIWGSVVKAVGNAKPAAAPPAPPKDKYVVHSDYAELCKSGVCYEFYKKKVRQRDAVKNCANHNGYSLVMVKDKREHDLIWATGKRYGLVKYWIAGTDTSHEGRWTDNSNKINIPYKYFRRGQPDNNTGNQNCLWVGLYGGDQWDDIQCTRMLGFVCRKN